LPPAVAVLINYANFGHLFFICNNMGSLISFIAAIISIAIIILSAIVRSIIRASKPSQRSYYSQNEYIENKGVVLPQSGESYKTYPSLITFGVKNTNCEIRIGTGVGSEMLSCLQKAHSSVDVVSPYLSNSMVRELITLAEKGVKIRLVTNDDTIEKIHDNIVKDIFKQERTTDEEQKKKRERLIRERSRLVLITWGLFVANVVVGFVMMNLWALAGLLPILILIIIISDYADKIDDVKVYNYSYRTLFPIKIFQSYNTTFKKKYIHSKVYIIDEQMAFLGSFNFTESGIGSNSNSNSIFSYETSVKITEERTVKEVKRYVDCLFLLSKGGMNWEMDLYDKTEDVKNEWKKKDYYPEPKN